MKAKIKLDELKERIYLTGYKNHFFKIRFTYYKSAETYAKETLIRFFDEIGNILAQKNVYIIITSPKIIC